MIDLLDHDDLIAELRMLRSSFPGSLFVVEGPSDCRLFERFVDQAHCQVIPGFGKNSVVKAIVALDGIAFRGLLGIVDADHWHLAGQPSPSPNLLITEVTDVELLVATQGCLERVADEFGSAPKKNAFLRATGHRSITEAILEVTFPIGVLRWVSERDGFRLKFQEVNVGDFFRLDDLRLEKGRLVGRLLQLTANPSLTTERVNLAWEAAMAEELLPPLTCKGHDLVQVLSRGLRRAFGNKRKDEVIPENLESIFRLTFDYEDFRRTELYTDIREWEEGNPPYSVLRA